MKSGIYVKAFADEGIESILPQPDEQEKILKYIYDVKGGKYPENPKDFTDILDSMMARGADYFVLGCTELPLIADHLKLHDRYNLLDTTYEQAKAAVVACGYELNI